ncbi:MAG: 3-oxoacyl-ACP synthase [Candidatus Omnitrophica bacterium]|nr:3-oxoacyl-ACP synthase [Candidatus Omnitrophota bacterium]
MSVTLQIVAAGMVTAVGLDASSACAAMRGRLDGFQETRFLGPDGEWLVGAPVPAPRNWVGEARMAHLAAGAICEIFSAVSEAKGRTALILCLAEEDRPGRPVRYAARLAGKIAEIVEISPRTQIIANGRPSGFIALRQAQRLLSQRAADYVLITGVDNYLTSVTIAHYLKAGRLLTPANANGFIPGEGAAAVLCAAESEGALKLAGLGLSRESAFIYNRMDADGLDLPLRGDGMTRAYREALAEAGVTMARIDYRIADLIGEQYWFKQSTLAEMRLERGRTEFQDIWSPAENLGNIGAAVVPVMIGMALAAARKGYSGGSPLLIEASGDDGACGAAVFHERVM